MRGVGIDIVDVARFAEKLEKPEFLTLVFSPAELDYCMAKANKAECLAARFAAKEAYMKAVGQGWTSEADFKQIVIERDALGKPFLTFTGNTLRYFNTEGFASATLSISHTKQTAVAVVIVL